jgi:hypothetical protein
MMQLENFLHRAKVLDLSKCILVDGNLTVEVDIQVYKDKSPSWEPTKTLHLDMIKLLESADQSGDVTFEVGPEEFSAHLNIFKCVHHSQRRYSIRISITSSLCVYR